MSAPQGRLALFRRARASGGCVARPAGAVLGEAAALRAADVPARVLWVQDWTGQRVNLDGGLGVPYRWEADAAHYPDLAGLVATLHAQGFQFLAYVGPFVDPSLSTSL